MDVSQSNVYIYAFIYNEDNYTIKKDFDDNLLSATNRKCNWNTNRDQMTKKRNM